MKSHGTPLAETTATHRMTLQYYTVRVMDQWFVCLVDTTNLKLTNISARTRWPDDYSMSTNHNLVQGFAQKYKQETGENKQVIHPIPPNNLERKDKRMLAFPFPNINDRSVNQESLNSFMNGIRSECHRQNVNDWNTSSFLFGVGGYWFGRLFLIEFLVM